MGADGYAKFSVSMPVAVKRQVESRVTKAVLAEDRSSVLSRDLNRYYAGLLKQGLKTLRNAHLSPDERACIAVLLGSTVFEPDYIPLLAASLEDAAYEMRSFGVDPDALIAKVRQLDVVALYALVDLIERDPDMGEIA